MLYYLYPQWVWEKSRYPKYTMNFLLWVPLIIFLLCRFFYFWQLYFSTKKMLAAAFIRWTLLSYIFLTIGFLYFPFHNIAIFKGKKYWLREINPTFYDFIAYDAVPWIFYAFLSLYFICKWQAQKYHKKAVLQPQNKNKTTIIKKDLNKTKWIGNIFFILWFWLLYCNTCVGWYFPFDWR